MTLTTEQRERLEREIAARENSPESFDEQLTEDYRALLSAHDAAQDDARRLREALRKIADQSARDHDDPEQEAYASRGIAAAALKQGERNG